MSLRRAALAALAAAALLPTATVGADTDAPFVWHLPAGFPVPLVPSDNPMSEAKVALGRRLFFDPRLSLTGAYSCSSCHDPARALTDGRVLAVGATGESLASNTPSLIDVAYRPSLRSSAGPVRTLEAQLCKVLFNDRPVEIGLKGREEELIAQLAADQDVARRFGAAFVHDGSPLTITHLIQAIAAYERTLVGGHSAFDRYVYYDDANALTAAARRGMALFYSSRTSCANCHFGIDFSGELQFQDHPIASHRRVMRPTPSLRNVALTAPYLHDGRVGTLEALIDDYDAGGRLSRRRDPRLRALHLTTAEKADLVAFLVSLTDRE